MFVQLAPDIIRRIILFLVFEDGRSVLNLLYTNKHLYYNYIGLFYQLRPLIVPWYQSTIAAANNPYIANAVTYVIVFNHSKTYSGVFSNFNRFTALRMLSIWTKNLTFLHVLNHLPPKLTKLDIMFDVKFTGFSLREMGIPIFRRDVTRPIPLVRSLTILSQKYLVLSRISSLMCVVLNLTPSNYHNSQRVVQYHRFLRKIKWDLVRFGGFLYSLISLFRPSLHLLEIRRIEFPLIFDPLRVPMNYAFVNLRLLVLDNISFTRYRTWFRPFQRANSDIRNGNYLHTIVVDNFSKTYYIKTNVPDTVWYYSSFSQPVLEMINSKLGIV